LGVSAVEAKKPSFDLCWRTYACLKGKKEARAAWDALPAEVDRAAVIEAAAAWQASWAAQGKRDAPRKHLARWLKDELYDEDAPTGYVKQERASKATSKPTTKRQPAAPITARITACEVVTLLNGSELRFTATDEAGVEHEHVIRLEHPDEETQFAGQRRLAKLVHGAGLEQIEDSSELHGRTIVITGEEFSAPSVRPDDEPPIAVKPEPAPLPVLQKSAERASVDNDPYGTKEWERRYTARQERAAGLKAWDEANAELFEDKRAANADWPEWLGAEYEEDDAA
jgi:PIN domain nuclease of toxin-antitoxin system